MRVSREAGMRTTVRKAEVNQKRSRVAAVAAIPMVVEVRARIFSAIPAVSRRRFSSRSRRRNARPTTPVAPAAVIRVGADARRRQAEQLQGQNDDARGNSRYVETRGQDRREDRQDRREDRWDRREDRIDRREDYWDAREDRHDRREDRRDYREDRRDSHRWNTWNDWYRHDYRQDHRYDYRYGNHRDDWHRSDWRRSWRHGWAGTRYRSPYRYYYPSGFSYRSWRIGYELPLAFLIADYFLDYRPYGLAPPPYGCRWLRVGDDVMLVDMRSGVIVDILYNFYY